MARANSADRIRSGDFRFFDFAEEFQLAARAFKWDSLALGFQVVTFSNRDRAFIIAALVSGAEGFERVLQFLPYRWSAWEFR